MLFYKIHLPRVPAGGGLSDTVAQLDDLSDEGRARPVVGALFTDVEARRPVLARSVERSASPSQPKVSESPFH